MRIRFFISDKKREKTLARSFATGAERLGDKVEIVDRCAEPDCSAVDAVAMVGVKAKKIYDAAMQAGAIPIMFDKGYTRHRRNGSGVWEYWRISIGDHHPTKMMGKLIKGGRCPANRFDSLHQYVRPWRERGKYIILAGSSAKYHDFYGLPHPTGWAENVVAQIREISDLQIHYRPKPSWREAEEIEGTIYSDAKDKLGVLLNEAHCVVTHGSNISWEAALYGVPSIVLGSGVGALLGGVRIDQIGAPPMIDRDPWFHCLAHFQWTENEMASGRMWKFFRGTGKLV